jgi:predicted dehydrogenase/threonine dehydrogenase-like Zn-dependent dehydrogenase
VALKQVLIRQGQVVVEEIPSPRVEPGTILVCVDHSCISIGTEMSGIKASATPLWRRALEQPEKVKKVLHLVATEGFSKTRNMIEGKLSTGNPTGYSAAGTVLEIGEGIEDFKPGDRVACAGAQYAHHAEIIRVPRNLTVRVPDLLDFPTASTVTLGAIALQGVRRVNPTLGETFVVIGLGILGQLTIQMLKANGCKVIGSDLDSSRTQMALTLGMDAKINPDNGNDIEQVARLTDGYGADGVIVTAASSSDLIVSTAFKMCRKKGRVVLVGNVGLNLNREDIYQKELDFFISTSYGPGRYDNTYEEKGLDYPLPYIRWTENRNMSEYLRLVAEEKIKIQPLISEIYPVEQASAAYEVLKSSLKKPLMVLLSYPHSKDPDKYRRIVLNPIAHPAKSGQIRIALIGAGDFAKGMHLPNLQKLSHYYHLQAVMSRTGYNATATAKQFNAHYATTDYQQILKDPEIDAVLICTRHHLHATMTLEALKAGKHVLVEKPLALSQEELDQINNFYASIPSGSHLPILLTGFNRRFSRFARRIKELVSQRTHPMILNYRMNAGYIPLNHWVHTEEGGGRNIGEACHIYDLFTFLTDSKVTQVKAQSIQTTTGYYSSRDNFVTTITFEDGSLATLTYTALGSKDYPKEQMEVFVDGKILALDNYKRLTVFGSKEKGIEAKLSDKGQKEELETFASAIQQGGNWPIPLWQQIQTNEISLEVEKCLVSLKN